MHSLIITPTFADTPATIAVIHLSILTPFHFETELGEVLQR